MALKKILIIDDDHDTLDLLELILHKQYDVSTALNGFDGLARVQESPPECILSDIAMPVMDGIAFINRLRKLPSMNRIPVVAVTSFIDKNPMKSLLSVGFADVIGKPFNAADILKTVRMAIASRSA